MGNFTLGGRQAKIGLFSPFFFFHVLDHANLQRKTPLPKSHNFLDILGKNLELSFLGF